MINNYIKRITRRVIILIKRVLINRPLKKKYYIDWNIRRWLIRKPGLPIGVFRRYIGAGLQPKTKIYVFRMNVFRWVPRNEKIYATLIFARGD